MLLLLLIASAAHAQLEGRIAERPIGVGYVRGVNQATGFEYIQHLAERLEVGSTMFETIPTEQLEAFRSKLDVPVGGLSVYMVQGLLPGFEPLYFQEVIDAADAKRVVQARTEVFGNASKVITEGDGRYVLVQINTWSQPVPEQQDPKEFVAKIQEQRAGSNRSLTFTAELDEENGKPVVKRTWQRKEYFRYHDNLLFSSDFEELFEMDLPSRDSLTSSISSANDAGAEAFFDRIPIAIKQLGWNMLNSTAGTQMQRRDGEDAAEADLRREALSNGLAVVRAVMFDVQEANGWVRFATDSEQAVRAEVNLKTRRNSGLTKQLEELAGGRSRFAPILKDDAAATVHACVQLSDDSAALFEAAANWVQYTINRETNGDTAMVEAAARVADSIAAFGEHRVLETLLKVGWSEDSDGVLFGGLQVDNNPDLLRGLTNLLLHSDMPADIKDRISLQELAGREVLTIEIPEGGVAEIQEETSLKLTHIYLMHQSSCLWFAVGSANAVQMLHQSIDRCETSGLSARTPLLSARLDVDRWLSYPAEDDDTGVAGLISWLDRNSFEFPPSPASMGRFFRNPNDKPTPLLQPCLDLGGEQSASLTLIADSGGVRVSARVGEAIANYYLARMVDTQDHLMKSQRERQERMRAEAEAKRKQAQNN